LRIRGYFCCVTIGELMSSDGIPCVIPYDREVNAQP